MNLQANSLGLVRSVSSEEVGRLPSHIRSTLGTRQKLPNRVISISPPGWWHASMRQLPMWWSTVEVVGLGGGECHFLARSRRLLAVPGGILPPVLIIIRGCAWNSWRRYSGVWAPVVVARVSAAWLRPLLTNLRPPFSSRIPGCFRTIRFGSWYESQHAFRRG